MGFLDDAKSKLKDFTKQNEGSKQSGSFGKVTMRNNEHDNRPVNMEFDGDGFEMDERTGSEYFERVQKQQDEYINSFDEKHLVEVKDGRIQDVLYLLNIPSTFELKDFVLLPEDLEGLEFDVQYPKGYEIGQVNNFISQTSRTIKELIRLLKERNRHIAELATTIDRLQVDVSNLKTDATLANGINIMPTDDADELQGEILNLRMLVSRQEEELNNYKQAGHQPMTDREQNEYENLKDEYSIIVRNRNDLIDENESLRSQIAQLIEDNDMQSNSLENQSFGTGDLDLGGFDNIRNQHEQADANSMSWDDFSDYDGKPANQNDDEPEKNMISTLRPIPHSLAEVTVEQDFSDLEPVVEENANPFHDPTYEAPFGTQNFSGNMDAASFELDLSEFSGDFSNTDFTAKIEAAKQSKDDLFYDPDAESLHDFMVTNQKYYNGEPQGGIVDGASAIEFLDDEGNTH